MKCVYFSSAYNCGLFTVHAKDVIYSIWSVNHKEGVSGISSGHSYELVSTPLQQRQGPT